MPESRRKPLRSGARPGEIWKELDPGLWELTANPWLILQATSPQKLPALRVTTQEAELAFEVEVQLGRIDPAAVRVELCAEPQPGPPAFRKEMQRIASASAAAGVYRYSIRTQATRAAADFTPRILPHHALALGPEICRILWQKCRRGVIVP
jgi:hypothetical protein